MATEHRTGLLDRFPALRKLQARTGRRVPEIRQMTLTDCGAACLAMVLGYHGREARLDEVREVMGATRDGVTAKSLIEAARRLGLRGRGVSIDLDRLSFLPPASILHWNFTHFVVFERLGKGCIHIVDPAQGRRQVSLEHFSQNFTGVALLLEPAEDFQAGGSKRGGAFRYLLPLLQQSDTLRSIVVLSAALQLFALAIPIFTGMAVDRVVPRGDYHLLVVLSTALVALVVFQFLTSIIRGHLMLELRTQLDSKMTLGFLDHLVGLAYPFFQMRPAGDLLMRLNIQATIREILSSTATASLLDGAMVLFYFAVLFALNGKMGLLAMGLALAQVLVFILSHRKLRSLLSQNLELDAKNQNYQIGMLTGMQTLKAFGAERRAVENYSHLFADVLNVGLQRGRLTLWVDSLTNMLRLISPLVLLSVGSYFVLEKKLTLGEMLSLNALANALLVPLSNLVTTAGQFQLLGSYLERINDVLDAPPERPAENPGVAIQLQGAITLEKVSFSHGPYSPLVLRDVSLHIEPGQMVALVGRSGAGKTTLANLLMGLCLPTSGRVLYDGKDLTGLDLRSVRSQMGIVLQEPTFFGFSLRHNIALGNPDLPLDRVMEAARLAHLHEDIMSMPLQYGTPLADGGLSLSGGQRQRLALARALACQPAIVLLDEATSALDAVTERQVQDSLARLQCTRIVIAHRLSTIRTADVIVVMDAGLVVEQGRHEELLKRGGAYAQLIQAQMEQTPLGQTG